MATTTVNVQARMRIVRESPAEVFFRYDGRSAMTVGLGMGVGLWACLTFIPSPAKWFAGGVTGLILLFCVAGAFWREELELGLATGRWRRRAGWAGKIQETTGNLTE